MCRKIFSLIAVLTISFLMSGVAIADDIEWRPIAGTEHNMIAYGKVYISGVDFSNGDFILVSFGLGGKIDCRSVTPIQPDGVFYTTIVGNTVGETLSFMVADKSSGKTYSLSDKIVFKADGLLENVQIQ